MGEGRVPLSGVDVSALSMALDDHSEWSQWWFDPATGRTELSTDSSVDGIEDDLDTDRMVLVEPQPSRAAYEDMVVFAEAVADQRTSELLLRVLQGKGAFRRFRDALYDFEELGLRWRDFSDLAAERRALEWLDLHDLADAGDLERAIEDRRQGADEILADLAADQGPSFAAEDVPQRWGEITTHLDQGQPVTIKKADKPWAIIQPTV